jgi:hypothetical protein
MAHASPGRVGQSGTLLAGALVAALSACATPARPTPPSPGPASSAALNGEYLATFHTPYSGPVRFRLTAEPTDEGFKANTRPGVAWTMFGGLERVLGPVLTPFLFPSGMILTWRSSVPHQGSPGVGTLGVGSLPSLRIATRMDEPQGPVDLIFEKDRPVGVLTLVPASGSEGPAADYPALARAVADLMREHLYDPALATSPQVNSYLADLSAGADKSRDDVEFLFASLVSARRNLRIGTPLIYRPPDPSAASLLAGRPEPPKPYRITRDAASGVATLRLDGLFDAGDVDEAFRAALEPAPAGLILDLRTSPGPAPAAFRAAAWVVDQPTEAGVYFDQRHRESVLAGGGGTIEGIDPAGLAADQPLPGGAARFVIRPAHNPFTGPVVVLTSRRTSSTAEALACALRACGRARLVGEATAGRPYLSAEFDAGQGWVLRLPCYDYRDPSGHAVPASGLRPDVPCPRDQAPRRALELIARGTDAVAESNAGD